MERKSPRYLALSKKSQMCVRIPRGILKSPGTDSHSSDPIVNKNAIVGEGKVPAAALGLWEWLDGAGDVPDGLVLSCRLCRCKVCCAAIAEWMLRCWDHTINCHDRRYCNMVSVHDLGVNVVNYPSFLQVRGGALPFLVQLLSNRNRHFKNQGAKRLFVFPGAILGIYCDAMLIRC